MKRLSIYDIEYVDELVEDDEITSREAGFMYWYDADSEDFETIL